MSTNFSPVYIGNTPIRGTERQVAGEYVDLMGERFYKIHNFDMMPPFFMSLVSSTDHWFFVSSTGGLTAGRVDIDQALFPYYTEDKLTENSENTGGKTILLFRRSDKTWLWEPFSIRQQHQYDIQRNLYKNIPGTVLVFEEINYDLDLTYRYAWQTSDLFGFVKTSWLLNGDTPCCVELLDGLQNILPAKTPANIQNTLSCLLDAYKRNEFDPDTGLAIYALNSTLTDLAEPSESLLATTVFQVGLDDSSYLLSSAQLDRFRTGQGITPEAEIRGCRGSFFVHANMDLDRGQESTWRLVADVHQDSAAIVRTINSLRTKPGSLGQQVEADIALNTVNLEKIVASADGLQVSANPLCTAQHFANVMFNVMRGGIFADQYRINKTDFTDYVTTHNSEVVHTHSAFFASLPEKILAAELHARAASTGSTDLIRLSCTYLPLTFSRRHGDPSRPWNRFSIHLNNADGSQRLGYEGNWRDIFQNWEALAYSYPEFVEGMIYTFLCATTADGYNPYRITRAGIDWEIPEPGNPWANIGYWSDHQIIYLLKLMELSVRVHPGKLRDSLEKHILSYANVPYRIKPFDDMLKDPYNTIRFDHDLESEIEARVKSHGTDGKLIYSTKGQVLYRSLAEKLLTLLLAKLVNFVPEGGIWMNTQRPEWNDANNALVGKGLSVVTLGYLRRYIVFCKELFSQRAPTNLRISAEVADLFSEVFSILAAFSPHLKKSFDDKGRCDMISALGHAGSDYREKIYQHGFTEKFLQLSVRELFAFFDLAQRYIEHALQANRRSDNLYHAYNILHIDEQHASISHLYEMLEGQVSILSSGILSAEESCTLIESLRHSALYRSDQDSYLLYPDKVIPGFLQKNSLSAEQVRSLHLPKALAQRKDKSLLIRDMDGVYRFSGSIRNVKDVWQALESLRRQPEYAELVSVEGDRIAGLFESVFRHNEFTGRSGTFFAYEGLGSVYWHMVAKLLLAVQETLFRYQKDPAAPKLRQQYMDIRAGLSFNKTPSAYGAFPTDPYSHTPKGQRARQPGMTGLVKELILVRQAELGLSIDDGCLIFNPLLLDRSELLPDAAIYRYLGVNGSEKCIKLDPGALACSICQTPVILQTGDQSEIRVDFVDGGAQTITGHHLDGTNSQSIFQRNGAIRQLTFRFLP